MHIVSVLSPQARILPLYNMWAYSVLTHVTNTDGVFRPGTGMSQEVTELVNSSTVLNTPVDNVHCHPRLVNNKTACRTKFQLVSYSCMV